MRCLYRIQVAILVAVAACTGKREEAPEIPRAGEPLAVEAKQPSLQGASARRAWLEAAEEFLATPAHAPASKRQFRELVSSDAWAEIEPSALAEKAELLRFFPVVTKITTTLATRRAFDQLVDLGLFQLDANRALLDAGERFVAELPADDPTIAVRRNGLTKIRVGAAMVICETLYFLLDASDDSRARAFEVLSDPARYSIFSREELQLIVATLDERLVELAGEHRTRYEEVREIAASERADRKAPASSVRVTYQAIEPPIPAEPEAKISTTGGFSVTIWPAALARKVEIDRPGGATETQHWIAHKHGETRFEAACLDGQSEDEAVAALAKTFNLVARPGPHRHPGRWFTIHAPGRSGVVRFVTIGGRACLASVEGPIGQVDHSVADAFLASLTPS